MEEGITQVKDQNENKPDGNEQVEGIIPKGTGKRGRPPGSKNGTKKIDTGPLRENRVESVPTVNSTESAKFVAAGFVSLIELAESFVHNNCSKKIERRHPEKLSEFKQLAESLGLQPKDKELIADCAEKIAVRHDLLIKYAPEAVLAITLAQYSLRQMSLVNFVNNVTKPKPQNITVKPNEVQPVGQ